MECKDIEKQLIVLIEKKEGKIPDRVQEHINYCPECENLLKAHQAVCDSLSSIAPERKYLTEERLEKLLDEVTPSRERKNIIDMSFRHKVQYAAGGVAAALLLTITSFFLLSGIDTTEETPGGMERRTLSTGEAVASSDEDADDGVLSASAFQLFDEFNRAVRTTAYAEEERFVNSSAVERGGMQSEVIKISTEGVDVPVKDISHLRQDDYWW